MSIKDILSVLITRLGKRVFDANPSSSGFRDQNAGMLDEVLRGLGCGGKDSGRGGGKSGGRGGAGSGRGQR